jgi:uncharacterized membrane protein YjjP (DUF1212 family)
MFGGLAAHWWHHVQRSLRRFCHVMLIPSVFCLSSEFMVILSRHEEESTERRRRVKTWGQILTDMKELSNTRQLGKKSSG